MSTCNRLDLQTLGSQPITPKNLPDHTWKHLGSQLGQSKSLPGLWVFARPLYIYNYLIN